MSNLVSTPKRERDGDDIVEPVGSPTKRQKSGEAAPLVIGEEKKEKEEEDTHYENLLRDAKSLLATVQDLRIIVQDLVQSRENRVAGGGPKSRWWYFVGTGEDGGLDSVMWDSWSTKDAEKIKNFLCYVNNACKIETGHPPLYMNKVLETLVSGLASPEPERAKIFEEELETWGVKMKKSHPWDWDAFGFMTIDWGTWGRLNIREMLLENVNVIGYDTYC